MRKSTNEKQTSQAIVSRRTLLVGGIQAGLVGVLGARMHYLQVQESDQFRFLAEENRIKISLIPPARGQVFDRTGRPLAQNVQSYRVTITREDAGDIDETIARLGQLIQLDPELVAEARVELKKRRGDTQVTIAEKVTWEELARVAANAPALPGIEPQVALSRHYPLGADFTHVIGYVGPVSDYDLSRIENPDPLLNLPRFQIGKTGLEAREEEELRGKAGTMRLEVNASGREVRELGRQEGKPGADIQLTIDHMLQNYVQARLGSESAAAVVIDCESGDLLAIGSSPAFDPNLFVNGISVNDYNGLIEDDHRPLVSKSVQGTYPPGSTFKMVTALAALEAGIVSSEDTYRCKGHLEVYSQKFGCWKRSGHGNVDLVRSLRESCDVYFYELALETGIERISEMARRLGIGERHDIPMSAVAEGLAPTKEWKNRVKGEDWVIGDSVNASIGQGFVLASPLQLAVMTARLATGRAVTPRLIKTIDGVEQPSGAGAPMGLNENHLRQIRKGMYEVVNHGSGTARGSRITSPDHQMAGKTGTSQVISRRVKCDEVPWRQRDHALFVNYAPYDNPRIAVSIVVEHGCGGSSTAAPIARDITLQALYGEDPPLSAYPARDRGRISAQQKRLREMRPPVQGEEPERA
ncbi:penicillin-binding protein 2 [Lentibacter algarum]|jgi:penicillin-binding protein 2|uniref:Peptidoglycan glycosyltransferase n=4 Tax=Lentibacter algarum TaxID=576131 RepID=A0A1H3JU74_9RHOB|nr:penicillin-binding protein 2 [Lentibacter algarum]MCO4828861.1 penicillin-binding protein 2 [Lentibacter algarum]WIF32326.1 penicillin-binding protein 2 [Lentibacter algarum]SDY43065.1 peptidoglycan glycosyltransferase [Lentibacter algarum]